MSSSGFTTVAKADTPVEADLLRMRLEQAGLSPLVRDQNMIRMNPILSGVFGGIRIDVPLAEAEQAREVLAERSPDSPQEVSTQPVSCPQCGGRDLRPVSRRTIRSLVAMVLSLHTMTGGVPRPVANRFRCRSCGEQVEGS